ncbi:MAG: transglutaminase-like domain-containing protein [Candidatus Binatia bacterium]
MHLAEAMPAYLAAIPPGDDGIAATLSLMARIARAYSKLPQFYVLSREIANAAGIEGKDHAGEAESIYDFVRENVTYRRDIDGVESLQTPERTLALASGDCDDQATLVATLAKTLGFPARYVAAGINGSDLVHVWTELKIGESWYAADTTEANGFGWRPPGITKRMIETL